MRVTLEIDETLIQEVLEVTGLGSQREAVDLALRTLLQMKKQAHIREYKGKLKWDGDLNTMRES